jgi:O-antigen/teichoic acid export membrane protein
MSTLKSRFKQLGKDSIVYGLGGMIARGMGFFLLPLYTRFFVPADYGVIETLNILNSFLGALLVMGMDSAQSFFFFQQKENGQPAQARVVSGILQFRLAWGALIIAIAMLIAPLLNAYFLGGRLSWEHFAAAFLGAFVTQLANQSAEVYRLQRRPWSYIGITLGNSITTALATIALVSLLDWGIFGYFVGNGLGSLIAALIGWWSIRGYLDWSKWHRDWWPRLVRFGAPLVPTALGMYILNTADRWVIIQYQGQTVLGIYAVADKFAAMLAILVITFRQAWWPIAMDAIHSSDGPALLRMMGRLYLGLACIGVILLTAFSPLLVQWLTTPAYYSAYLLIGMLAWQPLNYGFQMIIGIGIWKAEKTVWSSVSLGLAAILNVLLALWLVPLYGSMGAAIATAAAYFGWNAITLALSEKFWPVNYPLGIFAMQIAVGIFSSAAILLLDRGEEVWKVVLIAAMGILALLGLTVKRSQLDWALTELRNGRLSLVGGKK